MAKEEWAVPIEYLVKAIYDLENLRSSEGFEKETIPKLLGYCNEQDLGEAVEAAKKIPPKKLTPTRSQSDLNNPDFNFVPDFCVINDFLAHTLYEEMILFMKKKYFDENYEDDDWGYDNEWFEIEESEDDFIYLTIGKEAFDGFGEPMVATFIDRLIYADGEPVEFDDVLEHYGNLKKHFLDLDNSFWMGKSFASRHSGLQAPYGFKDE